MKENILTRSTINIWMSLSKYELLIYFVAPHIFLLALARVSTNFVPPWNWKTYCFSSFVRLSVRLSFRPSVCLSVTLSCPLYIFWTPSGIYKYLCTNVKYDETICIINVWSRSVQGQGHNLRVNIVWLYFVSALYLLNTWRDLQITLHKCQEWWDDVQCPCLTKVGSRSRS